MQTTTETEQRIFKAIKSVCGWCPDAREQTMALVKEGFEVSHGMCPACVAKMDAELAKRGTR